MVLKEDIIFTLFFAISYWVLATKAEEHHNVTELSLVEIKEDPFDRMPYIWNILSEIILDLDPSEEIFRIDQEKLEEQEILEELLFNSTVNQEKITNNVNKIMEGIWLLSRYRVEIRKRIEEHHNTLRIFQTVTHTTYLISYKEIIRKELIMLNERLEEMEKWDEACNNLTVRIMLISLLMKDYNIEL